MTWVDRTKHAAMPFQTWNAFPPDAIVQIKNAYGESRIGPAKDFSWGYEREFGQVGEGVIVKARRLDRPRQPPTEAEIADAHRARFDRRDDHAA